MPQELLFELNGVRITPHRNIWRHLVSDRERGKRECRPSQKFNPVAVLVFLLGLGILGIAIVNSRMTGLAEEYFAMAATGVAVMLGAFFLQLVWPGRVHVLILRISSGAVEALTSRDKGFVFNVQKAIEQAFVVRARQLDLPQPRETGAESRRLERSAVFGQTCGSLVVGMKPVLLRRSQP